MMRSREYKYPDKADRVEGWQITYSSLALIIVVVFVMLVSYSVMDKRKMGHLQGAVKGEANLREGRQIEGKNTGLANVDSDSDSGGAWINEAVNSLKNSGAASGLRNDIKVQRFGNGLKLKFNSDIVFPLGSAQVSEKIYPYLDEIAKIADKKGLFLRVEGHTDDIPVNTAEFPSNWELSTKRAVNIVRYLIEEKGFPAERLAAEGFGQFHPLVSGADPEGKKQNRRIEIYIEPENKSVSTSDGKSHE